MRQAFEITRNSRKVLSGFMQQYTLEQLNKVPEGFNNNMIWNIGHIVVVQQMLVYALSGLPMMVPDHMVNKYKRGTRPEGDVSREEADEIRSLLFETISQTENDLERQLFKTYSEFTTMTGFTVQDAEDAIAFNYYHEAMHTGMIMSIRKFI